MNALRALTSAAIVATVLVSSAAHAQEDRLDPLSSKHSNQHSPQHFEIELRLSAFAPDIDGDPALHGETPYKDVFGTSPQLLVAGEFDWQALRIPHFGSLGPAASAGWTTKSGLANFTTPHNGSTVSGETTSLAIFPFAAMAVLRVDVLWKDVGIPLVPYAKLGLAYALWRASNTLGTSDYKGVSGKGSSLGTHVSLGLALNLNVFDMYAAQNFDDSMGVNGSYLFAEYTREDMTGLGFQSDPLRVGGQNATFGLGFEF